MQFLKYSPTQQILPGNSCYADAVNHCKAFKEYISRNDEVTSVHEVTHRINADIRNGAITSVPFYGTTIIKPVGRQDTNAFYVMKDRAIKIPEPASKKSDCVKYIPKSMQYGRFGLYVAGQKEWDDSPLYLFDEWTAYCNGGDAVLDLFQRNEWKLGQTDFMFAPLEFVTYATATVMAAGSLSDVLRDFTKWQIARSFNLYFQGMKMQPWGDADKLYGQLKTGSEANDIRTFLKDKLDFMIPDQFQPDGPSNDTINFYV